MAEAFQDELRALINRHSRENESDTPDFLLAEYLRDCLVAFERTVRGRDQWYGFKGLGTRLEQPLAAPPPAVEEHKDG